MPQLLILLYLIIFIFIAFRRFEYGLYLFFAFLPSYLLRFNLGPLPTTVLEIQLGLLLLIWLVKRYPTYKDFKLSELKNLPYLIPGGLIFIASIIAVIISPEKIAALGLWRAYFLEPMLLAIICYEQINTKQKLKNIFWCLGFAVLYSVLPAIYQALTGDWIPNPYWQQLAVRRSVGLFDYPNALALFCAPIIALFIGWLPDNFRNIKQTLAKLTVIIAGLINIYLAQSQGAWVATAAVVVCLGLLYKKTRAATLVISIIGLIILFTVPAFKNLAYNQILMRDYSGQIRLKMWQETWQMLKTTPFLGAGLHGYQAAVAPFHTQDWIEIYLYPHNIILNFWSELGLLGLLGFSWLIFDFIGYCVKILRKSLNQEDKFLTFTALGVLTALIVHGLVDAPYFKNDLAMLWWVMFLIPPIIYKLRDYTN